LTATGAPQPISWLAAQKRAFMATSVGALALFVTGALAGLPERLAVPSLWWVLWPGALYYLTVVFAFLLPLWIVQAVIYAQMWQRGQPVFIAVADGEGTAPNRRCRFLLSLRTFVFVLAVLYLPSGAGRERTWTRPAWLYLGLFATALLAFCLWTTTFMSAPPPLPLLAAIVFWSSSLVLGMSDVLRGD
jgi:hypothetical protein